MVPYIFMIHYTIMYHSMAKDNLNESKETTSTTTTALKVAPLRTIILKN